MDTEALKTMIIIGLIIIGYLLTYMSFTYYVSNYMERKYNIGIGTSVIISALTFIVGTLLIIYFSL
jgi:hypothetical protein